MTVVDTSVAVKWFIAGERRHAEARALLESTPVLLAPDLLVVEAANVLWKKVRAGELTSDQARDIVAVLSGGLELVPTTSLVAAALDLALELDHPVYDCVYLALARDRDTVLVTADEQFHRTASASAHEGRTRLLSEP